MKTMFPQESYIVANPNKIALFGGGFNPIGRHHEYAALKIHDQTDMTVWLMPCYKHAFDKDNELIEDSHRWNMTEGVANSYGPAIAACDWEIINQSDGKMYNTIRGIQKDHPDKEFTIVIGMDNANIITNDISEGGWYKGAELVEEHPFIVMTRKIPCPVCQTKATQCEFCKEKGFVWQEPKVDWFKKEPHMVIEIAYAQSSSGLRLACKEGRLPYVIQHTHPLTWDYIQSGRLYGLSNSANV